MIVDIDKIIVKDRIRKDFGDIQELADDIKQNGLINPPVVNKEYELLAGERRLRACKSLGWSQIEIRMMDTRDAEHELNVEISENDVRKGFTKSERVDYMKRLLRIEQAKAKERQDLGLKSDEGSRADDATAKQFNLGRDTMRKEMSIVENKDLLSAEDFADWDEGKLSTNKAFQKIKAELAEKDRRIKALERDGKEREDYISTRELYIHELESREPEVKTVTKTVEKVPEDYEALKKKASKVNAIAKDLDTEKRKVDEKQKKILELQDRVAELEGATMQGLDHANLAENIAYFCTMCNNFIGNVGGLVWLTDRIADMPVREREMFLKAAVSFRDWASAFSDNLERSMNGNREQSSVIGIPLQDDSGTESNQ